MNFDALNGFSPIPYTYKNRPHYIITVEGDRSLLGAKLGAKHH
jgi:hypothetical protein